MTLGSGGRLEVLLASAAVTAALAVGPAGAGATTTIGETVAPNSICGTNTTNLQTDSPGGGYEAPAAGVLTSWSFQASVDTVPPELRLKVARRAGGAFFTIVGESPFIVPSPGALSTQPIQLPVQQGDLLGLYQRVFGKCTRSEQPGYGLGFFPGELGPGVTQPYTIDPPPAGQLGVSATLETTPCKGKPPTIGGTAGNDSLTGTAEADVIVGLEGNDRISGLGDKDIICGGDGKDKLKGGGGRDTLLGQGGKDRLSGGGGRDSCSGGKGNDSASCEVEK